MKRILIIGLGGAGKSTLAQKLGEKLGLEVLHLDRFYWSSGWIKPAPEEWTRTVTKLISRDSWIIDGDYSGTLTQRIAACDTIIFLDLPAIVCLWRITKRRLLYRSKTRPDMAAGCPEKLDLEFVQWVLGYTRQTRPKVVKVLQDSLATKRVIWLRSHEDINQFLKLVA